MRNTPALGVLADPREVRSICRHDLHILAENLRAPKSVPGHIFTSTSILSMLDARDYIIYY